MTITGKQEIVEKRQADKSDIVVSVNGVSKKFCRDLKRSLMYGVKDISAELLGLSRKGDQLRPQEFRALNDVSFQLRRGEALGLLGKNGSGKSTLLRIIAGLIKPDMGTVEINGRVAPLIALGAGFNPILTGRENIYANMSVLGLTKQEIDQRFDDVIAFAEIGDAIETPVQSYSSGMAARLGFATAIHTEPDILLIDEVLSVGDVKFRTKCSRRLAELQEKGTTFILVSHNSSSILSVCQSAIYLEKGELISRGSAYEIMKQYENSLFIEATDAVSSGMSFLTGKNREESLGANITYLGFRDESGEVLSFPETGKKTYFCIGCHVFKHLENFGIGIAIKDPAKGNEILLQIESRDDGEILPLQQGDSEVQIEMPFLCLAPGVYEMQIHLQIVAPRKYDLEEISAFRFQVKEPEGIYLINSKNQFYQPRGWDVVKV